MGRRFNLGEVRRPALSCFISTSGVRCVRGKQVKKKLVSLFIGVLSFCAVTAQSEKVDSTITRSDSIQCVLIEVAVTKDISVLDSVAANSPSSSIADLLLEQSNVQVNSYGSKGGIQSLSIRGYSTSQNQVNWNGMAINSLTLGLFNFAGSSAGSFDEVNLIKGTASAYYGSAAIGGVVVLNNHPDWDQGLNLSIGGDWGSFHSVMEQYKIGYSSKNFSYKFSYQNEFIKNDFEYQNIKKIGKPFEIQTDGEFWNTNVVQEIYYKKGANRFKLLGWANGNKKKIPQLLTENTPTTQFVADSSMRIVLGYDRDFSKSALELLYGFIGNRFNYVDKANFIDNKYSIYEQMLSANYSGNYKNFHFRVESKNQLQEVVNSKYKGDPRRFLSFDVLSVRRVVQKNTTILSSAGAQFASSSNYVAPIYSVGYHSVLLKERMILKGGFSSHYRLPSFDDLYWGTGGNPDLKSEKGWNVEQNVKIYSSKKTSHFKIEGYYSEINDWIMWTPAGSFWIPKNLKKVACYGVEGEIESSRNIGKARLTVRSSGSITRNVVLESRITNDEAIGNQARYVPIYSHFTTVGMAYKKFVLQYAIRYQGIRHTAYDNNPDLALPSYYLSSVKLWRKTKLYHSEAFLKFSVENIFNTSYQSVENYAMPGRAYYLTLLLHANFKNQH